MILKLVMLLAALVAAQCHTAFLSCSAGPASLCGGRRSTALGPVRHSFSLDSQQGKQVRHFEMLGDVAARGCLMKPNTHIDSA